MAARNNLIIYFMQSVSRLSPFAIVQEACYRQTGQVLPKQLASRIVQLAGFILPQVSRPSLTDRLRKLVLGKDPAYELIAALERGDWEGAWKASCALAGKKLNTGAKVVEFIAKNQMAEAEFLILHTDKINAYLALSRVLDLALFERAVPCYLKIGKTMQILKMRVELDPTNGRAQLELAKFYIHHYSSWDIHYIHDNLHFDTYGIWPIGLLLAAIHNEPTCADAYFYLHIGCPEEGVTLRNGKKMTKEELCWMCIHLDPNDYRPYWSLYILEGSIEFLQKAHALNPDFSEANYKIAVRMRDPNEAKALLLKAISSNPRMGKYYSRLADLLSAGERVFLPHLNREMDENDLRQYAKEYSGRGWTFFDSGMRSHDATRAMYLKKAINCGLNNNMRASAFYYWAHCRVEDDPSEEELLLKCIEINPYYIGAWFRLAELRSRSYPKQECYIHIIAYRPKEQSAYRLLADTLRFKTSTVTLKDGNVYTKEKLYAIADNLSRT